MRQSAVHPRRRGVSMLWALLVLSIVTVLTAALTKQLLLDRRSAEQRRQQAQCLWLARSGVEMAAERLLRDPAGYTGEMIELIPHSQIRIVVQAEKENVVVVTSEARYPTDDSPAVQTLTRRYRRTVEKGVARLEPVTDKERE